MDVKEKLVELLAPTSLNFEKAVYLADYLIAHGVTVQDNTEITDELLKQLRNAPLTVLHEEPTVEVVQEWISVNDRLPEKEGFYLVATKYGTVYRELYFLCGDPPEPSFGWNGVSKGKYTHWMPLPQPPKGE